MTLLEVMLTWMVSYLEVTLKVMTAFLVLFRLSPVQETVLWIRWFPPLLLFVDLVC